MLIVEDDRSQALFAEGILRNAGMDTLVVLEPLDVLPALQQFQPDLILMDLHMPDANGIELTALIREQEPSCTRRSCSCPAKATRTGSSTRSTPAATTSSSKPIRPKHLIAAVKNRVRAPPRAGSAAQRTPRQGRRSPACTSAASCSSS